MKNFLIVLLAALLISIGIGLIMYFNSNNTNINQHIQKKNNTYSVDETKEQSLNPNSLKQISISSSFTDINVIPENRNNVKIHFHGNIKCHSLNKSKNPIPKLDISNQNDNLVIETKKSSDDSNSSLFSNFNLYFNSNLTLDIFVPSSYKNSINISSSSGNINIKNFELNSLVIKTSSGDMKIDLITAKNMNLSSSSGDFICNNLTTDDFHTESSSGDMKGNKIAAKNTNFSSSSGNFICSNLNTDKTYAKTSSGDIKLYDYTGNLNLTATSGNAITQYSKFDNDVCIKSSSGDVKLQLPYSSQFYLYAHSSSGDITCDFPITIKGEHKDNKLQGTVKSNSNNINITTSSGNIIMKSQK